MPDYSKAIIYKLCCKDPNIKDIYIGSTCNFIKRKSAHKCHCNKETHNDYNTYKYQFIRDNGGWCNWIMVMVKEFSCENKRQLESEERKQIEELKPTLNHNVPTRTPKEYKQAHMTFYQKYNKEYRLENKQKLCEKAKEYYNENKQKLYEKSKEYKLENKDKIAEQRKEYRLKNKQKLCEKTKEYQLKNKEKIAEKAKEKIECDICKCMVRKCAFKRHTRSLKHQNNIDN